MTAPLAVKATTAAAMLDSLPLILRQLRRRFDAMRHQPVTYLAPQILRAELPVAHDVLQLAAEVGRDGLRPVWHGHLPFAVRKCTAL